MKQFVQTRISFNNFIQITIPLIFKVLIFHVSKISFYSPNLIKCLAKRFIAGKRLEIMFLYQIFIKLSKNNSKSKGKKQLMELSFNFFSANCNQMKAAIAKHITCCKMFNFYFTFINI